VARGGAFPRAGPSVLIPRRQGVDRRPLPPSLLLLLMGLCRRVASSALVDGTLPPPSEGVLSRRQGPGPDASSMSSSVGRGPRGGGDADGGGGPTPPNSHRNCDIKIGKYFGVIAFLLKRSEKHANNSNMTQEKNERVFRGNGIKPTQTQLVKNLEGRMK